MNFFLLLIYDLWFQAKHGDDKRDTIKIFIGNLRENANANKLRAAFEEFGTVVECVVLDKYGFVVSIHPCFVEFISGNIELDLHFDGLVQERRNSSALAMELCLSCINPSIWRCFSALDIWKTGVFTVPATPVKFTRYCLTQ